MKLYKVSAIFQGKDLNHKSTAGYLTAESDEDVYEILNKMLFKEDYDEEWDQYYAINKEILINARGDWEQEWMGEFFDIKYIWEDLGDMSAEDFKILDKFNVLEFGIIEL